MAELQVTSIDAIKKVVQGEIIELPPFEDGTPFVARVRKPNMLTLVSNGKIPNALLSSVSELFKKNKEGKIKPEDMGDEDSINKLSDTMKLFRIMADAALVEPTLKAIEEVGATLSDQQLVAIFNYTQSGVAALQSFREEQTRVESDTDQPKVQSKTKRNTRP